MPTLISAASLLALGEGVAQRIATDADPALGIVWATGDYPADVRTPITLARMWPNPDRAIVLSPRRLTADSTLADTEYALQARFRAEPGDVAGLWALIDAVSGLLLGRWPTVLPNGLPIRSVTYAGGTPLPLDGNDRPEHSDNYVFGVSEDRARPF